VASLTCISHTLSCAHTVIDRLYDQNVGYWQPDLQGLDHLGRADRAELLVDYLGISEKQLVKTVERLADDGKYELAASLLESSGSRFEHSTSVANAKRLVYLKSDGRESEYGPVQIHHLLWKDRRTNTADGQWQMMKR
jgi:hypothetical protein